MDVFASRRKLRAASVVMSYADNLSVIFANGWSVGSN